MRCQRPEPDFSSDGQLRTSASYGHQAILHFSQTWSQQKNLKGSIKENFNIYLTVATGW